MILSDRADSEIFTTKKQPNALHIATKIDTNSHLVEKYFNRAVITWIFSWIRLELLATLEHNASIIGTLRSIIGEIFGKFLEAFWVNFWAYSTQAYCLLTDKMCYSNY